MKTTLSLAALGLASLALCNCQQQNEPVAPATETTAPIVVTPVKTVDMSSGLAPESIAAGQIIELWAAPNKSSEASDYIDFNGVNVGTNRFPNTAVTYTKTGPKTAQISGGGQTYILTFTSSTKGKVSGAQDAVRFMITH